MKLFRKKLKAQQRWRSSARMIDLHKTKVTLLTNEKLEESRPEHLPLMIYEKLQVTLPSTETMLMEASKTNMPSQRLYVGGNIMRLHQ